MLLPVEKELRSVLARFADARFRHDLHPSGQSSRELQDTSDSLCALTGTRSVEQALAAADALLDRLRADRHTATRAGQTLAA
ncbi:DUF5133 domain-containing protein [Streptomyces sp. NPDC040750]|uniref:DUF5133 domain-containing protein n=1 Tax=Streptomyces sp. NPDC040750 TaxID=3154491 RepID=UPI003404DB2C